jgi:hypothetical protein
MGALFWYTDDAEFRNSRILFPEVIMGILRSIGTFFKSEEDSVQRQKVGRNDSCWCGSGKKYKKCHLHEDEKKQTGRYHLNCGSS